MHKVHTIKTQNQNELFAVFVDSLFRDTRYIASGAVLQGTLIGLIWLWTNNILFLICFAVMAVVTVWRLNQSRKYEIEKAAFSSQSRAEKEKWATIWERRYCVSTMAIACNAGVVAELCVRLSEDSFVLICGMSLIFCILPSIVGRLFGSKRLGWATIIAMFTPVAAGAAISFDYQNLIILALIIPYSFTIMKLVDNVRLPVIQAVQRTQQIAAIARQFDIAVNTMTHGLVMVDNKGRVAVINDEAKRIFDVSPTISIEGRPLEILFRLARRTNSLTPKAAKELENLVPQMIGSGDHRRIVDLGQGTQIAISSKFRADNGTVLVIEDISEMVAADIKLQHLARYDALTGLANRSYFSQLVRDSLQVAGKTAHAGLILLDIDDFKHVNDSIGHAQGDQLLVSFAQRLNALGFDDAFACRHGGDEFMIFVPDIDTYGGIEAICTKTSEMLNGVYQLNQENLAVTTSIGCQICPASEFVLADAMVKADIALYRVKAQGKADIAYYNPDMEKNYRRRQLIKRELKVALDQGTLSVMYQPLINAKTGLMSGTEALSRWTHPTLGPISPGEFVPLAEETGLISQMTDFVIKRACQACATWPDQMRVSVNLSTIDFFGSDIVSVIRQALDEANLPAHRLDVELTETAVIRNRAQMEVLLKQIRELGVRVSLDDFGTGQSSLSYLHTLPLDTVKIDRSFVNGITEDTRKVALLKSVSNLCHTLGMCVTIEGVETEAQLELVKNEGRADHIQGFLFSPALPSSAIREIAQRQLKDPTTQIKVLAQ